MPQWPGQGSAEMQAHWPEALHTCPVGQFPQLWPQPFPPHTRLPQEQAGRQVPVWSSQVSPSAQVPQSPWHPSLPHIRPVQLGVQETQLPCSSQISFEGHVPQEPPQLSGPHARPVQAGTQAPPSVFSRQRRVAGSQIWLVLQTAQVCDWHPSQTSPHSTPAHGSAWGVHDPSGVLASVRT
jgi:hypothetical protein